MFASRALFASWVLAISITMPHALRTWETKRGSQHAPPRVVAYLTTKTGTGLEGVCRLVLTRLSELTIREFFGSHCRRENSYPGQDNAGKPSGSVRVCGKHLGISALLTSAEGGMDTSSIYNFLQVMYVGRITLGPLQGFTT